MEENGDQSNSPEGLKTVGENARSGEGDDLELTLGHRPIGIQAMCLINLEGRPIVRLQVQGKDDQVLMDSSQDLEDTLALGAFIVEATADVLDEVAKMLKQSVWRKGIGEHFESYLERTESATRRLRRQLPVERN